MINEVLNLTVKTEGQNPEYTASLKCFIPNVGLKAVEGGKRAVIVCPGGGYRNRAGHESEPIAMAFAASGIATFILNYSVAPAIFPQAVCEAAEAVKIVRENAEKWGINPDKIMICGFSAGGHLAAGLGVFYDKPQVLENLGCAARDCKPNGMILAYPVISGGEFAHKDSFERLMGEPYDIERAQNFSIEKHVSESTPPAFIMHTFEDTAVPVQNSLLLASALAEYKVNTELHIYPHGDHGIGLANGVAGIFQPEAEDWFQLAIRWAKKL